MIKKYFWLGLIALLFLVTRLYKINTIPSSVYWDEASIGYNAYSITTDLKDEWGETLPLHFRSFGEFKLPVYIYSVATLVKLIGLNEFAVRLPSVLFTLGTIVVLYFLVSKVSKSERIGLIASFIFSVSPWTFIFSRTGYEAMAGLFFFLLFIYFLLFSHKNKKNIFLALIFAIASFYSYNSFRILIPISIVVWGLTQKHKNLKLELIALALFLISLFPLVKLFYLDTGGARLTAVGSLNPTSIVRNYFSHFDFKFLFLEGDINSRHQQEGWGQLYIIELSLLLIGLWKVLKNKDRSMWPFLLLLVIAPIPASITKESPHALRAIVMAPAIAAISATALSSFRRFCMTVFVLIYVLFFGIYFRDFILMYNQKTSSDWQYEYKEIFSKTKSGVISDKYAQPYIFALYYLKYSPQEFRSSVKYNPPDKWGFSTVRSFGEFEFK
jgi:4-amino-4-deoxy-L-arabinose transferase-like glycosyltransferase